MWALCDVHVNLITNYRLLSLYQMFRKEGMDVLASVIFFDRQQGGLERIKHIHGVDTHWFV